MFPNMPFNIIMEDLRHTHSLEVTTDNILEGNIAVPSVSDIPQLELKYCKWEDFEVGTKMINKVTTR